MQLTNISDSSSQSTSKNKELPNIILFSAASSISLFGTSIYNFAIGLYVLKLTGSGLSFATTLVLSILSTMLVTPFAGVLADRLDKKLLAIITDTLNGILLISLYLITKGYALSLFMIYVCTFLLNVFTAVYGISIEAAKPNIVSEKRLVSMNSINKIIEASSSILGPMVGGIVFAFLNIRFFMVINGFSFIISAILQLFIDFKFNYSPRKEENEEKKKSGFAADMLEGLSYVKKRKYILNLFGVFVVLNFFIGLSITVPVPYIINNVLKLSAKFYGIIESALPVGMILGALVIKKIMGKVSYQKIIKSTNVILSICMAAIGFSVVLHYQIYNNMFYLVYLILVMIITGIVIAFINIPIFYLLQTTISDEFRGRVLSLGMSAAKMILPAGLVIAGAFIGSIPEYILPMAGGIGLCIYSLLCIRIDL